MILEIGLPIAALTLVGVFIYADHRSRKAHREELVRLTHKQPMLCRFCGAVWVLRFDGEWNDDPSNASAREAMEAHRCGSNCDKCNGRGFIPVNGVEQNE
jgi:hypothetical protein